MEEALAELSIGGDGSRRKSAKPQDEDDWSTALPARTDRIASLEAKLKEVRKGIGGDRAKLLKLQQDTVGMALEDHIPERRWLAGTRPNGKIHREASQALAKAPAWMWTTGCGWKFGVSAHYEWVGEGDMEGHTAKLCDAGCDVPR